MLILTTLACLATNHPVEPADSLVAPHPSGVVTLDTFDMGTITVATGGLIDMDHPESAELTEDKRTVNILLHQVRHPNGAMVLVDSGLTSDGDGGVMHVSSLLTNAFDLQVEQSTAQVLGDEQPDAVFFTHLHSDHVMGLGGLDLQVPLVVGPGEADERKAEYVALRSTFRRLFDGRPPLQELQPDAALEGLEATDIFGDGSFMALHVPGHTAGSLAFLLHTSEGAVLLTGDTCHTRWGWEHGVAPGTYTADAEQNEASLGALQAIAQEHDARVIFGHEL